MGVARVRPETFFTLFNVNSQYPQFLLPVGNEIATDGQCRNKFLLEMCSILLKIKSNVKKLLLFILFF